MAFETQQNAPVLLTPTRRLAHRLRVAHDVHCEAAGLHVWSTLEAMPWQAWLVQQYALARRDGHHDGRVLAPEAAALLWRRIVAEDPAEPGALSPAGLALAAHRAWRRMQAWRIPEAALAAEQTPETQAFLRWIRGYTAWLAERRAIDPDTIAEALEPATVRRPLRLVGFDEFTPAQSRLLARLREAGCVVAIEPPAVRHGVLARVDCRDARAELEAAGRWAAAWLDRDQRARLGVVVPDLARRRTQVRRELERVLVPATGYVGGPSPESRTFAIDAAPPLSSRAVVAAALELLATFLAPPDPTAVGRLLRNPCVHAAPVEGAPRAMLDAWIRRHASRDVPLARLRELAAARHCPLLAEAIDRGLAVAGRADGRIPPSAWAGRFHDLLAALGWPGEKLSSSEYQAAERFRALLAELAAADEITGVLPTRAALALLREFADRVMFEPQEVDTSLVVVEPEAAVGMEFDGLWLTGMEAGRWPPPAAPDPFLPRAWQIRQGMPRADAALAAHQARRLFDRLTGSADETVVSVAKFEDETPVLASAMIATVGRSARPAWPHRTIAEAIHAGRPRLDWSIDARLPQSPPGLIARGGAKLLELQSACPFRAGAEFRLHARALEEPAPGLSPAERGDLVHRVLARVWTALRSQAELLTRDAAAVRGVVRASIDAEVNRLRRHATPLGRHLLALESARLEMRIVELLDCDRARAPFTVESVEAPRTVRVGALALEVKLDRVDRLADGALAVIDYKTGGDVKQSAWSGDRPHLPQVPLYAQAVGAERVAAVAFGVVRAERTCYVGLARDADAFGGIATLGDRDAPRGYESWEDLLAAWRARLLALANEYLSGDARLAPDPATACRHCHLASLCRINETPLRAEHMEATGD